MGNDDNKLLRDLGGLQALNNYIKSVDTQKEKTIKASGSLNFDIRDRFQLAKEMQHYLSIMTLTASNTETLNEFVESIQYLISVLREPILLPSDLAETIDLCITKVMQTLCDATSGNFAVKEYIQNSAFVSLLRHVTVLDNNLIIPEAIQTQIDRLKEVNN